MTRPPVPRRALLLLLLLAFSAVLFAQIRHARQSRSPCHGSSSEVYSPPALLIGPSAAVVGPVDIVVHEPIEFDGMTRCEVLDLRRSRLDEHPELVRDYRPAPAVYGQIVDGLPWWGMVGHFVHGPGERSTEGTSEESRFILNPLLLVGVDLYGVSIWNRDFSWDADKVAALETDEDALPLWVRPASLTWWPAESRAEVDYDITAFLDSVTEFAATAPTLPLGGTALMPQSARDLGFDFLFLDLDASTHIAQPHHSADPVAIRDFIHRGGSCGFPGGCNNGSPYQAPLDQIFVEELPARLVLKLWREQPVDAASAADMEFVIRFE